jgi:hypothetical protein
MPLLNESEIERLRQRQPIQCGVCKAQVRWEYCRVHDEFYTYGHVGSRCPEMTHSVRQCGERAVSLPEHGAKYFSLANRGCL